MSTGSIVLLVIGIVAALAVVGVVGLVVLYGLAGNPNRSAVRREVSLGEVDDYLAHDAGFAITIVANSPLTRAEIWDRLTGAPYMSSLPFLHGPTWAEREKTGMRGAPVAVGERRSMSGTILSVAERVISVEDRKSVTLVGTAVSLPLSIHSFVERWTLSDGPRGTVDVTWEIGGTPRWIGWLPWRWGAPFLRPILSFVLRHVLRLKPFRSTRGKTTTR